MPLAAGFNTCSEINSFLFLQSYELTSVTEYFKTLIKLNAHMFNKKSPIYPSKHLNFQLFTASILSKMLSSIAIFQNSAIIRYIIETINDLLKNTAQIVHSRHRSVSNFIINIISALGAYCFFDNKPKALTGYVIEDTKQLSLF